MLFREKNIPREHHQEHQTDFLDQDLMFSSEVSKEGRYSAKSRIHYASFCLIFKIQKDIKIFECKTFHPRGPSAPSLIAYAALKPFAVTSSATNSEFPSNLASLQSRK